MKRLLLLLVLLPVVALAQHGPQLGGSGSSGVSTAELNAAIAAALGEVNYYQTWVLPTTSIATTAYMGGYYEFPATASTFPTGSPVDFGRADNSYAAHVMFVTGATAVGDIILTITGDIITDSTVGAPGSATLTIPSGTVADTYFETPEKWLGEVTIETTTGTAISCNYGFCKYWDNSNTDFTVNGGEALWMGDFTGETINIELLHHKATGWTYHATAEPTTPTPLTSMADAHGDNVEVTSNDYGCFKRVPVTPTEVAGSASEGVLVRLTQSRAACIEYGQLTMGYKQ